MAGQELTGAGIVIKALLDQGVDVIFGYPGGAVLPIYDELFKQNALRHILVRHEQAAVHAAEGYARSTVKHPTYNPVVKADPARIEAAIDLMVTAKRPLFYCGGGVINAGPRAAKLLTQLVHLTGFPCTLTLMGLGAFPASDPQFLGMLGMGGRERAE